MKKFIKETAPMYLGVLDPELTKYQRNKAIDAILNAFKAVLFVVLVIVGFMYYKGLEKANKQDKLNKEQYGMDKY